MKSSTIQSTKLPSRAESLKMLDEWQMPDNIRRHTLQVNRIAVFLAKKLKQSGLDIDVDLVDRASLLHDLDKLRTLDNGEHGQVAEEYLARKGYPALGATVRQHRFEYVHDANLPWEGRIINYADKRVSHDKIVSLDDRLEDLKRRYHVTQPDLEAWAKFRNLEKEIFDRIELDPDKLESYLK